MSIATDKLAEYYAAETAILKGQKVLFDNAGTRREITHADLEMVQAGIKKWEAVVAAENRRAAGCGSVSYSLANFS
jgi:hypothetical protein